MLEYLNFLTQTADRDFEILHLTTELSKSCHSRLLYGYLCVFTDRYSPGYAGPVAKSMEEKTNQCTTLQLDHC